MKEKNEFNKIALDIISLFSSHKDELVKTLTKSNISTLIDVPKALFSNKLLQNAFYQYTSKAIEFNDAKAKANLVLMIEHLRNYTNHDHVIVSPELAKQIADNLTILLEEYYD